MTKTIPLTQGEVALVDDADYEWLSRWSWCFDHGYAVRGEKQKGKIYMHRMIMSFPSHLEVDHIDGHSLNNQRINLRLCTKSQNHMNMRAHVGASSKYKGVCWDSRGGKWHAQITLNYKNMNLGYFDDEQEAARAYNAEASKRFGEFARLNVIEEATC